MSQYFAPVVLDENGAPTHFMIAHEYGYGLNFSSQCEMTNEFVAAFATLLIQESPVRVVWAGDYSESGIYLAAYSSGEPYRPDTRSLNDPTFGSANVSPNYSPRVVPTPDSHPYLLNWDTREFVDFDRVPANSDNWVAHPLPVLTVDGTGIGNRYFDGRDQDDLIGRWLGQHLSLSSKSPSGNWTELPFTLTLAF